MSRSFDDNSTAIWTLKHRWLIIIDFEASRYFFNIMKIPKIMTDESDWTCIYTIELEIYVQNGPINKHIYVVRFTGHL